MRYDLDEDFWFNLREDEMASLGFGELGFRYCLGFSIS